jgi:hypothetical protein
LQAAIYNTYKYQELQPISNEKFENVAEVKATDTI